ncbi:MAG TPA: type I glyceraldehyde-3-phosphate dehydrogenase [Polyangia bacterium]|nr:type I glyceraldehyde-3-phosphate dehydrogenase [Polyangia bacterium]
MATRIGINGFGRIGRSFVRAWQENGYPADYEIVAVNDLTDAKTLAHLLAHDSVHGHYPGKVQASDGKLIVDGKHITVLAEKDPAKIAWSDHKVDIVVESTGRFTEAEKAKSHLSGSVKKVLISAPAKGQDVTLAVGINLESYDPKKHHVISNASCTTTCLAPIAKVMHETFGIAHGMMTTVHSYTNDQVNLDVPHKDLRRARAAAMSQIPTSTGAAKALSEVLPALKGKLDGFAVRVPTPNVSLVDLTVRCEKPVTKDAIIEAFRKASQNPSYMGVLAVTDEPLVSIDFNGDNHSATVDLLSTMVVGELAKVVAWYDNETGYAHRLYELTKYVAQKGL